MPQKSERAASRLKPRIARLILQRRKRNQQEALAQAQVKSQEAR